MVQVQIYFNNMLSLYHLADPLPNEKIITVIHRDVFIAIRRIIFFILLLLLPIIVFVMINILFPSLVQIPWFFPVLLITASAYVLFVWLLLFFSLVDYELDIWIITDQRIIDVRQEGFFARAIAEMRFNRIQDVTSEAKGLWPTLLHYGNVIVQTANDTNKLYFEQVANPEHIRDTLMKLMSDKKNSDSSPT